QRPGRGGEEHRGGESGHFSGTEREKDRPGGLRPAASLLQKNSRTGAGNGPSGTSGKENGDQRGILKQKRSEYRRGYPLLRHPGRQTCQRRFQASGQQGDGKSDPRSEEFRG